MKEKGKCWLMTNNKWIKKSGLEDFFKKAPEMEYTKAVDHYNLFIPVDRKKKESYTVGVATFECCFDCDFDPADKHEVKRWNEIIDFLLEKDSALKTYATKYMYQRAILWAVELKKPNEIVNKLFDETKTIEK